MPQTMAHSVQGGKIFITQVRLVAPDNTKVLVEEDLQISIAAVHLAPRSEILGDSHQGIPSQTRKDLAIQMDSLVEMTVGMTVAAEMEAPKAEAGLAQDVKM